MSTEDIRTTSKYTQLATKHGFMQSDKLTKWREQLFYINHGNKSSTKVHKHFFWTRKWKSHYKIKKKRCNVGYRSTPFNIINDLFFPHR